MKRRLALAAMLFAVIDCAPALAQSLTVTPLYGTELSPNSPAVIMGTNFRRGFSDDEYIVHRFKVTLEPGAIPVHVYQVDKFKLYIWLPLQFPPQLSHIRVENPYFIAFVPVASVKEVAPSVEARGTFAYTRPTTAFGEFVGTLTFPRGVGLMSVTLIADGLGLGGDGWTLVIQTGPTNEESSAGWEYEATAFPPSSATGIHGRISARIGPPPASGLYYIVIYKRLADGTISRSEARPIQFVVESEAP